MKKTLAEIESAFKESLEIPAIKSPKQLFFCPVGLVGAGKTTVTKPIAKRFGLIRLSSDELRKMLKENGYDYSPVKEIGLRIATEYALKGYGIAFDMDCGNPEVKDYVEAAAKKLGAKAIFVHVDTPQEFIFEKFRKHPPSWLADDPQKMIENYNSQKEKRAKEDTKFGFLYTFDTSRDDVAEQIEECVRKIERAFNT